jgi:hypothetical protein
MGEGRGVYRVSVGRPEVNRPVGRPRRRWEDNIKLDLREMGINWGKLDPDGARLGPVAGFCEHGDEPSGSIMKSGYFL